MTERPSPDHHFAEAARFLASAARSSSTERMHSDIALADAHGRLAERLIASG